MINIITGDSTKQTLHQYIFNYHSIFRKVKFYAVYMVSFCW